MGDVTDEDRVRLREDLQFARALHALAEKEVGALRAECAQLRALIFHTERGTSDAGSVKSSFSGTCA